MKTSFVSLTYCLCFAAAIAAFAPDAHAQTFVRPSRGGGLDTNAPMIHVDISYDFEANRMNAVLDTSHGVPSLVPLPEGYAFHSSSNYSVLSGKAYSLQYAWNPGAIFTPPEGGAVWVELLNSSEGLLTYDGPGNKNENPPRPYTGIFGTDESPNIWQWYGRMAHNAYAIEDSESEILYASYRVYFGDALTGAPMTGYDDEFVTLLWTTSAIPEPGSITLLMLMGLAIFLRRSIWKH